MERAYYSASIQQFVREEAESILGKIVSKSEFAVEQAQRVSWLAQIDQLKSQLNRLQGAIYIEYAIPRMGKRADVILLIGKALFVIEYKVGEREFAQSAEDQVTDYALDLKNFHESSHNVSIVPVLVATRAERQTYKLERTPHQDKLLKPIRSNGANLADIIREGQGFLSSETTLDGEEWEAGRYCPTPTIIEAAMALYNGHSVAEISRSDAGGEDLHRTTETIANIVAHAKANSCKVACFVTGVPGAGKTLIGLNVATQHFDREKNAYSVFLSGNGPLVKILQEALARDKVARSAAAGERLKKNAARSEVKMFIQNVHHYRDECLRDSSPPIDHIALFDEAQRAWNLQQTSRFMREKKNRPDFHQSEPEFLLSCMDRHPDWGVVVCLVGGGQEINTGEAGINEWVAALNRSFPHWHIHISDRLTDAEFGAGEAIRAISERQNVHFNSGLHLSVSMRSYRAENVSKLVKQILDIDVQGAQATLKDVNNQYPIMLTRDLERAKRWLKRQARGSERFGIVVSSQASRLKPMAIDVRLKPDPIHWFLAGKNDVRSSYYLEDVATEFDVQGLELDWVCVTWDADFRFRESGWTHCSFRGNRWQRINKQEKQVYLLKAAL